jgi:predicted dienelactone hydrolase
MVTRVQVGLCVALMGLAGAFMGCIESNPQPSPAADNGNPVAHEPDAVWSLDIASNQGTELVLDADVTVPEADLPAPPPECFGDLCPAGPDSAPDPSVKGPYPVGARTFSLDLLDNAGNPRTIRFEVWYPTTEEFRDGPYDAINFYEDAPEGIKPLVEKYQDSLPNIPVEVVRDAPVRKGNGPYPMVLFSHGAYGVRFQSVFYTVPLASHGYIVVSPDHTGATLYNLMEADGYNMDDLFLSGLDRPLDMVALLDEMLLWNGDEASDFHGSIDEANIGISGHSFGGYTALRVAFDDPRIKAAVPQEPVTTILDLFGYQWPEFPVPCMMQSAALDKTLDPQAEMYEPYLEMSAPKYYFELHTGGHFTYSDICILDLVYIANDLGIDDAENALDDGCADYNVDVAIAQPLINQFAIGFFNYYLRGSAGSYDYFTSKAADQLTDILKFELVEAAQ